MNEPRKAFRSRLLFMVASVACLAPFAVGALIGAEADEEDSLFKQLSVLSEVLTLIQRTYVDETSMRSLLDGALEGATDALDPMATFVPADQTAAYAETLSVGSSRSGVLVAKDRGIAYAVTVIEGSPGELAGLKRGDVIAAVDGVSTRNMALWHLQGVFAGEPGTELQLELLRNGQGESVTLQLGAFELPEPSLARQDDIAVLTVPSFDRRSLGKVRDLVGSLSDTDDRLIVDVRGAAAGEPEVAYEMAALFASGRLGNLMAREDELRAFDNDLPPLWQGRIAVAVDGGTQGSAEILVSVLEQSASATLVGEPTFGLAGRFGLIALPSGGELAMNDALFTGPDGEPIDERLIPDELVRASLRSISGEEGESEDRILDRAVEVLSRDEAKAA